MKINALASLVETNTRNGYYQTQYYPIDFGTNGRATSTNSLSSSKQFEVNADFNHSFGDHKIQAIAGYSYYDYWNERYYGMNYGYDTDIFHSIIWGQVLRCLQVKHHLPVISSPIN